ncbi:MAG TPA: SMP-30/gluconolactonase/LRE family protein [Pseudomonadales bacterium]
MTGGRTLATGLHFPEGPVARPGGELLVVEILTGWITKVTASGDVERLVRVGGGPNGLAIGPDGRGYVCNNGGMPASAAAELGLPVGETPSSRITPCVQAVDFGTGKVETLYESCDGWALQAPNDLVFDADGGFYFTDFGTRGRRARTRGRVLYARPDGNAIREVIGPIDEPNGVGLSPDGRTLYVAQTESARLWAFELDGPGVARTRPGPGLGGRLLFACPDLRWFDSLAVEADGNVCVGTLLQGAITVVSAGGGLVEQIPLDDPLPTNLCFGGEDGRTAYVTCSASGTILAIPWRRPGLVR